MYNNIIIIGGGTLAINIANYISKQNSNLIFLEYKSNASISSKNFCEKNGITFFDLDKTQITNFFLEIKGLTIVISVSNRYLFPREVLIKTNLCVINFHGALLPDFPGRNAEAWALFNLSSYGGITWHKVVEEVDKGDIIIQKKISFNEQHTSFRILREYMLIGFEAFVEIFQSLVRGDIKSTPQIILKKYKFNFSKDIPNNGYFDPTWSGPQMSAFLRAMDYGPLMILGNPLIKIDDVPYAIEKYSIKNNQNSDECINFNKEEGIVKIIKDGLHITLSSLSKI